MRAPLPKNETARLKALYQYEILDTSAEKAFDDLTRLAAYICGTPTALISLVDTDRQWFKSKVGLEASEISRDVAFCAHAILQPSLFTVPDARQDVRFFDNPLVTSELKIRFYAGAPLITPENYAIGTLCTIDYKPRELSREQTEALQILAGQVVSQLELRRNLINLTCANAEREQVESALRLKDRAMAAASSGIVITDPQQPDSPLIYCNPAFEKITGYSQNETLGRNCRFLQGPDTDPAVLEQIRSALREERECRAILKNYRKDGTPFWNELAISPVQDASGKLTHFIGVQTDITERKQAEEELSELKSRFVTITSHEFRTPLSTILSSAEIIQKYSHKLSEEKKLQHLEQIQTTVKNMTQLLNDLLFLSKAEAGKLEQLELPQFCRELVEEMQNYIDSV